MMLATIDPYILAFSAVTVFATVFMGFWSAKKSKTAGDFFVAGRSVSVGWNASAISGEYLSAASFMGIAGMVMSSGYDALWYPVCYACGYLFLLLFIAGPLRRFGAYTIPDFAEGRFDSPVFRKIAVCFVLFIGFFYTMPQMKGAGVTLAYIFPGLPYWVGVVLVGAVITLNVALGGMKGITLVQAFQYWAKMFAISVPIFVLMAVYGGYGRQLEENVQHRKELSLPPHIAFHPENHSASLVKITASNSYPSLSDEIKAKATRLGAIRSARERLPTPTCDMRVAFSWYSHYRPTLTDTETFYFDKSFGNFQRFMSWELGTARTQAPTNEVSPKQFRLYIEQLLATNGISVVRCDSGAPAIILTTNLAKFGLSAVGPASANDQNEEAAAAVSAGLSLVRKPLPEKAPADSAWLSLSPAETAATNRIAVSTSMSLSVVNGWVTLNSPRIVSRAEERLKAFFGQGQHYSVSNAKLVSVLLEYTELSGRTVIAHTNIGLTRMLGPLELNWNNWEKTLASVEQFLATNGVALRTESANTVRAVTPEQAVLWDQQTQVTTRRALPDKAPADSTWLSPFGPLTTKAAKAAKLSPEESKPYSLLYTYSLIIALVCGTAGLPHILVRFYTNPDGVAAKRTTMWVMILIGIFYVFPPVFGVMGRNLMPELYNGLTGVKGTDGIVLRLPTILREKYGALGSILSGVTCAGAFAAFMSTFSGLLVSMTGALAHDVYGRMLRPKSTSEQRLRAFKVCAVLIGGIAIVLGCFVEPLEINFMVGQAFAIAAASYFPLLFMSVWWRGMTMRGAAIGMLTGGLCALFAVTLTNVSNLALDKGPMGKVFAGFAPMNNLWAGHPLLRILCEQPAIWTVPLAIGLMIVLSKLTHRDVPSDVRAKMLVLHAPEKLGLKQEYIQEHQHGGH